MRVFWLEWVQAMDDIARAFKQLQNEVAMVVESWASCTQWATIDSCGDSSGIDDSRPERPWRPEHEVDRWAWERAKGVERPDITSHPARMRVNQPASSYG